MRNPVTNTLLKIVNFALLFIILSVILVAALYAIAGKEHATFWSGFAISAMSITTSALILNIDGCWSCITQLFKRLTL